MALVQLCMTLFSGWSVKTGYRLQEGSLRLKDSRLWSQNKAHRVLGKLQQREEKMSCSQVLCVLVKA